MATREYSFYQYGFDLILSSANEGVHLEVIFEDTRDSMNDRHSYETTLTDKSLESQGRSLESALELLENTYRELVECAIDYTEYQKPDRLVLKIYELESCETLLFIEFNTKNYA